MTDIEETSTENKAEGSRLGYVGRAPGASRDSNSWYTPAPYIEAARNALGGAIDLDPFSSLEANKVVKATRFFTEEDDAFAQNWASPVGGDNRVWMNPPYSGKLCADAVSRFLDEVNAGTITAGVFLVNNATETRWFQRALKMASAVCFTDHRISFWNADGKAISGNTRGQTFFYFGEKPALFASAFSARGTVITIAEDAVTGPPPRAERAKKN